MIQSTEEAPQKGPSARSPECSQLPHIQRPVTLSRRHAALPRPQTQCTFKRNIARLNEFHKKRSTACNHTQKPAKSALLSKKMPHISFYPRKNRIERYFKKNQYYTIK
jgi:hypothetical protein